MQPMLIHLPDNQNTEIEEGSSAKSLADALSLTAPDQALAAIINGKVTDLSTPLNEGDTVAFLPFQNPKGKEVFWHTSAHVLAQAVLRLYPKAQPTIGPPIEQGFYYDFANLNLSEDDLKPIEKEMQTIVRENTISKKKIFSSKKEALEAFGSNPYKVELINEISPEEELSGYRQGEFFDLCRGPHLYSLGKIKAIKLTKVSGAYWRGDANNEMLTRIYGITFPDKQQLKDHLNQIEEAKRRDHKILGPQLDLFSLHEEAPGMPFFHPKGMVIWNQLIAYQHELFKKYKYSEIKTPMLLTRELWERSGHWANYHEHMIISESEDRYFAVKPMNCPGCMLYYKKEIHSYRSLPLRIAEIGHVHRNELSGSLSGLMRCAFAVSTKTTPIFL